MISNSRMQTAATAIAALGFPVLTAYQAYDAVMHGRTLAGISAVFFAMGSVIFIAVLIGRIRGHN
jgi:hypothetical protein